MFARKVIAGVVLAGLAGAAMAQSVNQKSDVFGRPVINQTALQVYEQADPLGLLPQQAQRVGDSKIANPVKQTALEVYEQADPLGLLPQQAQTIGESKVADAVSGKTDILGRAFTGSYGLEALHSADPFSPVPQFWGHESDGNGVVATKLAAE